MPTFSRDRVRQADFYVDTDFRVIHEDEEILVVDKPAPLAAHPVGSYSELNLHSLLRKDPRWAGRELRFVHRLDAETSGVILIAKTPAAARFLGIEFLEGRVQKKYQALVFGVAPVAGRIDSPLGYDKSSGFQTVRTADPEKGEKASTRFRKISDNGIYSHLELEPETGRTHQLRAHLSFIGHPIVGDKIYIDLNIFSRYVINGLDAEMLERVKLPRLALHASWLAVRHPGTQEEISFTSALPAFFENFMKFQTPLDLLFSAEGGSASGRKKEGAGGSSK